MRVTICELPHEPVALNAAWAELCHYTALHAPELLLLPELAMVDPVWEWERFDAARWSAAEALSSCWIERLRELRAAYVVGTRPISSNGGHFNEGFLWSADEGLVPLRRKYFLPDETSYWEAQWFDKGDASFPAFHAGALSFGLNICTELWALETYADYAAAGVQVILSPRATAAATADRWLSLGTVAAVRSGAFSVSSNRVDPAGACGGGSWIIGPDGRLLARTNADAPFATLDLDLAASRAARDCHPCNVFGALSLTG